MPWPLLLSVRGWCVLSACKSDPSVFIEVSFVELLVERKYFNPDKSQMAGIESNDGEGESEDLRRREEQEGNENHTCWEAISQREVSIKRAR